LSAKKNTISEELNELETKLSSIEDKEKVLEELNRLENYERTYNEYILKLSNLKEQIQLKENEIANITEEATTPRVGKHVGSLRRICENAKSRNRFYKL